MIKLFVTDLDGCVTDPFITPDWEAFSGIRELNLKSELDPSIPKLSICTGRPMPYAEAMAQILGIRIPFVFESGGGMYDVTTNTLTWTPVLNDGVRRQVGPLVAGLRQEALLYNSIVGLMTVAKLVHKEDKVMQLCVAVCDDRIVQQ